jgi:hypothetical protein
VFFSTQTLLGIVLVLEHKETKVLLVADGSLALHGAMHKVAMVQANKVRHFADAAGLELLHQLVEPMNEIRSIERIGAGSDPCHILRATSLASSIQRLVCVCVCVCYGMDIHSDVEHAVGIELMLS